MTTAIPAPGCTCEPSSHSGHYSYCPLNALGIEVYERPVVYAVSILPEDHDHWNVNSRGYWSLEVRRAGPWDGSPDRWYVCRDGGTEMLTRRGNWIMRWDKLNRHHCYFATAEEALALARKHAAGVSVNGHPATELLAETEKYRATGKGWRERQ
jgi:hypothetical protein